MAESTSKRETETDGRIWQNRIKKEEKCALKFSRRNALKKVMSSQSDSEGEGKDEKRKKKMAAKKAKEEEQKVEAKEPEEEFVFIPQVIRCWMPCTEGPKSISLQENQLNNQIFCKPLRQPPPMFKELKPEDDVIHITLSGSCRILNPNAGLPNFGLCTRDRTCKKRVYPKRDGTVRVLQPNPFSTVFGSF